MATEPHGYIATKEEASGHLHEGGAAFAPLLVDSFVTM